MEDRQNTGISKRKGSAHSVSQGIDISKGVSPQASDPIECPEDKVMRDDHENLNCRQVASRNDDSVHGDPELDITNGDTTVPKADLAPTTKHPVRQATLLAKRKLKEWLSPSEHFISLGSVAICIVNDVMIT